MRKQWSSVRRGCAIYGGRGTGTESGDHRRIRDAAVGDREADLITAELSRECLDSAHRTLPVLQNRRFADPQLCD